MAYLAAPVAKPAVLKRPSLPHLPQLDGLRAAAIAIVIISHAGLGDLVPGGFGVTIFFFLSGFLITSLLRLERQSSGKVDLRGFYVRRTLRIIPPMFITIILCNILMIFNIVPREFSASGFVIDLLFLTNYDDYLGVHSTTPIPLWSLDVEEHFYIIFAVAFSAFLSKFSNFKVAKLCMIVCVIILGVRIFQYQMDASVSLIYYRSHTRIDAILFGSILALYKNPIIDSEYQTISLKYFCLAVVVVILSFFWRDDLFRETFRHSIHGICLLVIFSYILQLKGGPATLMGSRPFRVIATLSYTLYLAHLPIFLIAHEWSWPYPWISGTIVALAYSYLMNVWIEKPLAKRRSQIERKVAGWQI